MLLYASLLKTHVLSSHMSWPNAYVSSGNRSWRSWEAYRTGRKERPEIAWKGNSGEFHASLRVRRRLTAVFKHGNTFKSRTKSSNHPASQKHDQQVVSAAIKARGTHLSQNTHTTPETVSSNPSYLP